MQRKGVVNHEKEDHDTLIFKTENDKKALNALTK